MAHLSAAATTGRARWLLSMIGARFDTDCTTPVALAGTAARGLGSRDRVGDPSRSSGLLRSLEHRRGVQVNRAGDEQHDPAIRRSTKERMPRSGGAAVAPTATERRVIRLGFRHLVDELEVIPVA